MSRRLILRKQIMASSTSTGSARFSVFRGRIRTFVTHPVNQCDSNGGKGTNDYCSARSQIPLDMFQNQSSQKQQSFHQTTYNQQSLSPILLPHSPRGSHGASIFRTIRNFSYDSKRDSDAVIRNNHIVQLGRTGNWKDLLKLYRDEGNQFTNANYATAMTSLSRIRSFPKRDPIFDIFLEDIAQRLIRRPTHDDDDVRGGIQWFGTRAISNVVHSLAKMNLKSSPAHSILQNFLEPTNATWFVEEGSGQDISNALWSLAKLRFRPNPKTSSSALVLFQQVQQHMDQIIMGGESNDNNNTNTNYYSRKDGNNNDERRAVRSAATPVQVANIVWAFATLGIQGPKVFESVDKYAMWLAHEGQPHLIVRILWAFAKMNIHPPSLIKEIEKRADTLFLPPPDNQTNMKMKNNYNNTLHGASNVIWSFAKLSVHPSSKLMRNIEQVVVDSRHHDNSDRDGRQRQSSSLTPQVMGNMAWSLATLGIYSSSIFLEIESNAQTLVHFGSPQAISNTAWAFATLKIHSPNLFEIIDHQSVARYLVKGGSTQEIANVAWAFASLGYGDTNGESSANGLALFHAIEDNVHQLVKNANVKEIITLCYSIALLEDGCKHYENALRPLWNRAMELTATTAAKSPKIQHQKAELTDYHLRQLILVEVFTMANGLNLQKPSPLLRKKMESVDLADVQNKSLNQEPWLSS